MEKISLFQNILNRLKKKHLIAIEHEEEICNKSSVSTNIVIELFREREKVKVLSGAYKKLLNGESPTDKEGKLIETIIKKFD